MNIIEILITITATTVTVIVLVLAIKRTKRLLDQREGDDNFGLKIRKFCKFTLIFNVIGLLVVDFGGWLFFLLLDKILIDAIGILVIISFVIALALVIIFYRCH